MGSFRLAVGRRHLYRHCNFTWMFVETVFKSLHLSCGSELRVIPIFLLALTISSSEETFSSVSAYYDSVDLYFHSTVSVIFIVSCETTPVDTGSQCEIPTVFSCLHSILLGRNARARTSPLLAEFITEITLGTGNFFT